MTNAELKAAIAHMQAQRPRAARIWQNPNGTWSNHADAQREWADEIGCRTDLRFHEEWTR